jgi:Neprosin
MPSPQQLGERNDKEADQDVISENQDLDETRSPEIRDRNVEEIHEYLRARQAERAVVATTRTKRGQEIDWIDPASQTPDGRIADPPSEDGAPSFYDGRTPDDHQRWPHTPVQFELEVDEAARGPKGTVPLLRETIPAIRPVGTLEDFLSKHGRPTRLMRLNDHVEIPVPADTSKHVYAFTAQTMTCYGGEGNINIWAPYIQWSDEMTLGQIAMQRGTGYNHQTVEAGWQKLPNLYGDWNVHFFVFYTTNGYNYYGDGLGGYNEKVKGWVQVSPTIHPGTLPLSVSSYLGPQTYLNLKFQLSVGNWWLRVAGYWIGYYPATLFQSYGLLSQADNLEWFGEVADSKNHPGTTATDMGSGHFPWEGWQRAAYMNQLAIQTTPWGNMASYNPQTHYSTSAPCYDFAGNFANTGSWGPFFYWGGSGQNAWCP